MKPKGSLVLLAPMMRGRESRRLSKSGRPSSTAGKVFEGNTHAIRLTRITDMWLHADIKTLADIPRYYGKHAGDKIALISGTRTRSFRDLDLTSNRLANLIIRRGVAARSRVSFL